MGIIQLYYLLFFSIFFQSPLNEKWLLGSWQLEQMEAHSWQNNLEMQEKAQELSQETQITFEKNKERGKIYALFWQNQVKEKGSWNLDEQETFLTLNSEKGASTTYQIIEFTENNLAIYQVIENDTLTLSFQKE